jgi:hypothetical protein
MKIILNKNKTYTEQLEIERVDATNEHLLTVTTQFVSAKNPDALQTKFKSIVQMDSLVQLNAELDKYTKEK